MSVCCAECDRPARIQVAALLRQDVEAARLDPPEPVCLGHYHQMRQEAALQGLRLRAVPLDAGEPAAFEVGAPEAAPATV